MLPLDIEQPDELIAYLRRTGRINGQESPRVRVLAGGVSNKTVLVERDGDDGWVLKQALAKLRVKADWFSDPRRVEREALGLRWLEKLAPAGCITPLVFEDRAHHLLAMAAVPQPHENWKAMLLRGEVREEHVEQFGDLLGTVHRTSRAQAAQAEPVFRDQQFFESLRLEPYYLYTAQQTPAAAPFLHTLVADTRRRRLALVQGDYSPKNILVRDGRLVLLDHEVIHWGDPAFDVGFALAHLLSKAHHLPAHRHTFADAARRFWSAYGGDTEIEPFAVRHALGCLLARVAGRSPLEYLDATERERQSRAVVALMADLPNSIDALVQMFLQRIS